MSLLHKEVAGQYTIAIEYTGQFRKKSYTLWVQDNQTKVVFIVIDSDDAAYLEGMIPDLVTTARGLDI